MKSIVIPHKPQLIHVYDTYINIFLQLLYDIYCYSPVNTNQGS